MAKQKIDITPVELRDLLIEALTKTKTGHFYDIQDTIKEALPDNICPDCLHPMTPVGTKANPMYRCWLCYESSCYEGDG